MTRPTVFLVALLAVLSVSAVLAQGQSNSAVEQKPAAGAATSEQAQAEALQKAVQNPVASLISVPLQNNMNLSYGSFNRTQDVLNIQPVIPIKLSENWNLITRIIQPLVWQRYPNQNTGGEYGLGDMNPTFFLSPGKPGKLIWGVGPALVIPKQCVVGRRIGTPSAGQSDAAAVLHQLQPEEGLVLANGADPHLQLES